MADIPEEPKDMFGVRFGAFGDAAEALVEPVSASTVRSRAERRRTRRRVGLAGALSMVGAAAIAATVWLVLPGRQGPSEPARPAYVAAASVLPTPEPGGTLTQASLLAPDALPEHTAYDWHTAVIGKGTDVAPLPIGGCTLRLPAGMTPTAEVAALYTGHDHVRAQHRIAAYGRVQDAVYAMSATERTLRVCGWQRTATAGPDHAPAPDALHAYVRTVDDRSVSATVARRGDRVAVLFVVTRAHGTTHS
ncbi:hypothetical protein [Streptomyces longwoodensis]|uniref:hypothetical protein n=1 Tax=Streptomyces longwoodensis TaxID=68231 RepID=UPI0036E77784